MGDKHKHDTNGASEDVELTVGPEIVTYRDRYCTCGQCVDRIIVSRRKK